MLVHPQYKRKGIAGWKLSKNRPNYRSGNRTSSLTKRSKSTKPITFENAEENYLSEMNKLYNSSSKDSIQVYSNMKGSQNNKTIDASEQSSKLIKDDSISCLTNNKICAPIQSKQMSKKL